MNNTVNQIDLIDVYSREEIPGLASRNKCVTEFRRACTSQRIDKMRMWLNEKCFLSWNHTHEVSQEQSWKFSQQGVSSHPGYRPSAHANHFIKKKPTGKSSRQ